jgi:hypothetical protein
MADVAGNRETGGSVPTSPYSTDGKGFINWEVKYQIPEGTDLTVSATSIGLYPATRCQVPVDMGYRGLGNDRLRRDSQPRPVHAIYLIPNSAAAVCWTVSECS